MPGPDFLDTNILVYAYDPSDRAKQRIAQELVRKALAGDAGGPNTAFTFYDGMIVPAAERRGCGRIWPEDWNAGQSYFGAVVENPFRK